MLNFCSSLPLRRSPSAAGGIVRGSLDAPGKPRQCPRCPPPCRVCGPDGGGADALLKRFRTASTVFGVCILLALVYALVFRPIDTPPQAYDAPAVRQDTGAAQTALAADHKGTLDLGEYQGVDCIRTQDGLVYAAAYDGAALKKRTSDLVRTDGGHDAAILSVDGELTGFAFDGSGDLWLSILTPGGGSLCRAAHDSWGTAVEQVVTQIDGAPLGAVSAVEAAPDGRIYFAVAASASAANGLESTLRTELLAHTGTGCVYVYDPAARTVQKVLGGVAGASGLALSRDGSTLFVADLGNRCVWSAAADARDLTAGGKNCQSFVSGLPGYPGALAMDADGTLYIGYRWARSSWLEKNADSTLLRGIALRAGRNLQEKLFSLPADAPCAEAVDTADGSWKRTVSSKGAGGVTAQAVYAGIAPVLGENGIWLAAQCCEHLNRAIIIEREAAEKYGWEEVCVVPRPHAGGSWATTCWKKFREPVAVEEIRAHAGIDIGGTLIGMHLKRVAVPVRLSLSKIGEANILCARTRPKLIGGERAKYTEED